MPPSPTREILTPRHLRPHSSHGEPSKSGIESLTIHYYSIRNRFDAGSDHAIRVSCTIKIYQTNNFLFHLEPRWFKREPPAEKGKQDLHTELNMAPGQRSLPLSPSDKRNAAASAHPTGRRGGIVQPTQWPLIPTSSRRLKTRARIYEKTSLQILPPTLALWQQRW